MSLQSFLTNDQVNVVELYFCPESIEANSYVFQCGWKELPRLPVHLFKNRLDQQLTEYYHRDLIYSYDRSNDAQRTYQRTWIQDDLQGSMYTVAYQEESLPTHRFPCLQEINEKKTFHKIHYKINNRMYFILEKDETDWTFYLRYNHASNVELDKMNQDWQFALDKIQKQLYRKHSKGTHF